MAILSSLSFLPHTLSPKHTPKITTLFSSQSRPKKPPLLNLSIFSAATVDISGVGVGEDLPDNYSDYFPGVDRSQRRRAGVLLHPTSLRGRYGVGDLGEEAFRFVDWLHHAGVSVWQVLPLVPPGRKANEEGSPYSGQVDAYREYLPNDIKIMKKGKREVGQKAVSVPDANCGNTLLISLEELVKDGLLMKEELPTPINVDRVEYSNIAHIKDPLIAKAAERLVMSDGKLKNQLEDFRRDPNVSCWLEDAAYFAAIDNTLNTLSWYCWPEPLKNRHLSALEEIYENENEFINIFVAQQFLFQRQWKKVRDYARSKGISIMGDMPIYVGYHSADVWANKKHFLLNKSGFPLLVSGVPPDAFSETGQLWDSPLYDWEAMEKDGFSWWVRRIRRANDLYDEFRIDHFRGLAGFWAIPSEAKIATFGRWKAGPGKPFFDVLLRAVGKTNIIAEDLGVITEDVVQLRKSLGAPGMAVLQFAFGSDSDNPHLPHNHEQNQVVYSGTHDNDTVRGWWENLKQEEKSNVMNYLSIKEGDDISWALIQASFSSVAQTAIIPMQDILGLGSSSRMNIPATQFGNWSWRIPGSMSFDDLDVEAKKLRSLLSLYGRL